MTYTIIQIETECPFCKKKNPPVAATKEQYERYVGGKESIQYIFPNLSPQERESLITGMCAKCWREGTEE